MIYLKKFYFDNIVLNYCVHIINALSTVCEIIPHGRTKNYMTGSLNKYYSNASI